eukprot:TRINITY_DN50242_c0_g1_i1.p1 TRINITY_DN50242_c0_g1~~TRINITY_DN50242_c0_g1_i1.p1  ORF type:complete len:603 (-),score=125.08 TRINITY_DN50242_c0_g1_i1:140-1948(-)
MKALGKLRKTLAGGDVEGETARVELPETRISIVRVKPQPRKHKVISYGYRVLVNGEPPEMYRFEYTPDPDLPEDHHPGMIPAEFSAGVPVDDSMIYFYTRQGVEGPEYRTVFERQGLEGEDYHMSLDWTENVDGLWVSALKKLEEDEALSEEALNFLDADPLWLFGIADAATQRTLERTSVHPMLRCQGQRPCLAEWFCYLIADEDADAEFRWVVESFAEVELPQPYTSFKGVGNVVCYLNNETNETDWKHPYWDYFNQLLCHCRRSTHEDHLKLRINRMLWTYEAESQTDVAHQMPLVSPKYVKNLGDVLKVDLTVEPFLVRTLKTFLRAFSQMYHEGELDTQEIKWCLEIIQNERRKDELARNMYMEENPADMLDSPMPGQIRCIECPLVATCYCPECEDCFCEACFDKLHEKGSRQTHEPNHFILCAMCKVMPSKLQCTYTTNNYCIDCYTRKHAKTLPRFLDLKPLKIDYKKSIKDAIAQEGDDNKGKGDLAKAAAATSALIPQDKFTFSKGAPLETPLGEKWHGFYDLRGVKYYYNFETQESVRRPQDDLMVTPAEDDKEKEANKTEIIAFLAKSKDPRKLQEWAEPWKDDPWKPNL